MTGQTQRLKQIGELSSQALPLPQDMKAVTPKSHLPHVDAALCVFSQGETQLIIPQMQEPLAGEKSLFLIRPEVHSTEHLDEGI